VVRGGIECDKQAVAKKAIKKEQNMIVSEWMMSNMDCREESKKNSKALSSVKTHEIGSESMILRRVDLW